MVTLVRLYICMPLLYIFVTIWKLIRCRNQCFRIQWGVLLLRSSKFYDLKRKKKREKKAIVKTVWGTFYVLPSFKLGLFNPNTLLDKVLAVKNGNLRFFRVKHKFCYSTLQVCRGVTTARNIWKSIYFSWVFRKSIKSYLLK